MIIFMIIVYISLVVNILVAGFWGVILSRNTPFVPADKVFGVDSPARRILGCLYVGIALFSLVPFINASLLVPICLVLFSIQILYKVLSFVSLPRITNPVIASNLFIAVLHGTSVYFLLAQI